MKYERRYYRESKINLLNISNVHWFIVADSDSELVSFIEETGSIVFDRYISTRGTREDPKQFHEQL